MKPLSIAGLVLMVLGIAALAYQRITYTSSGTIADIGPIDATVEHQRTLPLPPVVSLLVVAAGIVVLVAGASKPA